MNLLLTDILACPRCGPPYGLILLSEDTRDRRVYEGWLGCANCRDRWVVSGGFAEFRAPLGEARPAGSGGAAGAKNEEAMRMAALLGVTEGPAYLLVAGPAASHAGAIADLLEEVEVIAALPILEHDDERTGVSRMAAGERLPFFGGRVHGVWLSGEAAATLLEEGIRVLRPMGRLVLEPAPQDADARLQSAGLSVLARREATIVAARNA